MFPPRQPGLPKQAHPKPQVPCLRDAGHLCLVGLPVRALSDLLHVLLDLHHANEFLYVERTDYFVERSDYWLERSDHGTK